MFENLSVLAGSKAIGIVRDEGLNLSRVKVLAGASGAAKFLVLTGIDRALLSLFKERKPPLHLIGTSIGAFRMAAYCQKIRVPMADSWFSYIDAIFCIWFAVGTHHWSTRMIR